MAVAVRVVACLDVHDGKVTKGVKFQGNVDVGDPLQLARKYDTELIDELVFYDITASAESRRSVVDLIQDTSDQIFIPFTVGGRRAAHAPSGFEVTSHGGRRDTGLDLLEWVQEGQRLGAGEIVVNSMDADGTRSGFDLGMLSAVREVSSVPVVASGGAGTPEHFVDAIRVGADAVLAAGIFHSGDVSVAEVKATIRSAGLAVR